MQIDSRNFQLHIDLILQEIAAAHFVAFDCEFTGLVTQQEQIEGLFPDHREFYERIKETALNFNLLQLGLTLFHFSEGQYFPKSYNFYVSAAHKKGFNKVILSEWDSLAFLARNGMDFNQAFRYGIEYKRLYGEELKTEQTNPLAARDYAEGKVFFNPEDRKTVEVIEGLIRREEHVRVDFKTKKIFDYFRGKYEMSFDKPKKNMDRYEYSIKIYARQEAEQPTEKSKMEEEAISPKVEQAMQEEKAGHPVSLEIVIAKIIECGKPIVGHFPNLDLGLIYHSFIAALPDTFEHFTQHLNQLFPFIFDTKVLSRRLQNRMKSMKVDLKSLYRACFNKKLLEPYSNINCKYVEEYTKEESSHEAGYDSFMTGCAFIGMLNYLYEGQQGPFVFANAQAENKVLYSKFAGEVSLVGPVYSEKTAYYSSRVVIVGALKKDHDWEALGGILSEFGTVTVYEDHGETYYLFDEEQKINELLEVDGRLKPYPDRSIVRSRVVF